LYRIGVQEGKQTNPQKRFFGETKMAKTQNSIRTIIACCGPKQYELTTDTKVANRSKKNSLEIRKIQSVIGNVADTPQLYGRKKSAASLIRGVESAPLREGYYEHQCGGLWALKSNPSKQYVGFFPKSYSSTTYYRVYENGQKGVADLPTYFPQLGDQKSYSCFQVNGKEGAYTPCKSYELRVGDMFVRGHH